MLQRDVLFFMRVALILCGYGASAFIFDHTHIASQRTFKAAVYEHAVVLPPERTIAVSRATALANMMKNLEIYQTQAELAGSMDVDILVFPEDGIYGMMMTRAAIKPYLEFIPDPKVVNWCPCTAPFRFSNTEVQQYLSCLARNNSVYLVANFGDAQPCNESDPKCPPDGQYQFNTDIVYDKTGRLIARYHKENLFFEYQFNRPQTSEYIYFDTPFGRFGVFTCFDIMFHDPAVALVDQYNVTNIVFPTAWIDALPLLAAVQFHSAFAAGAGVNLLAANIHKPQYGFHGSGIYTPSGSLSFYFNDTTDNGKLLVNEVNVVETTSDWSRYADKSVQTILDKPRISHDLQVAEFNSSVFHDIFTFKALEYSHGNLTVCQGSLCCHLEYFGKQGSEMYAFGVFDGLHTYEGGYYLQICALLKCASTGPESCGNSTASASTKFSQIKMKGNFSTPSVYPEILLSDHGELALPHPTNWKYDQDLIEFMDDKMSVLSVALFGRIYKKDP